MGLTVIVGFAIVAAGKEAGLFGSSSDDGAPQAAAEAPVPPPTLPPTAAPTPTPIVIERVVYRDEYLPGQSSNDDGGASSSSRHTNAPPPAATAGSGAPPSQPPATPASADNTPTAVDDGFHSQQAEFEGSIVSASENHFIVVGEHGEFPMTVTADTEVHGGALVVGAVVSVHAQSIPGGVWLANEIEVHGGDHEDD
ncbi:MAG: DUF5666 domain-containing protein [Dehalococcoidia bacterium]